jgi:hydrophobe/amphiphile efflux-1 (HAE1) family protein
MASMGVTASEVNAALAEQNVQVSPGRIGQAPTQGQQLTIMLKAKGRLATAKEFEDVIVRAKQDGTVVRLKDVARVELGTANYEFFGRLNGKPAALVGIFADANANALDTADEVYKTVDKLSKSFPAGLSYKVPYDTTKFVKISIREVIKTLFEALFMVICVVYLFLQSWRASVIPLIAVPVSLTGAFIGMFLLGYSINTLTLLGMVLAIGIVVDDAIVVVENMERIMQTEGLTPKEAAKKAMTQVTSPIIAIVLVLCAVFIPATFMGGMTGQLYKQFAMTIAISVVFSGFVALTLSPALGGLILREHEKEPARFFVWYNKWFADLTTRYVHGSEWLIKRWSVTLALYISAIAAVFWMSQTLPKAFLPAEDQGFFISVANLPDGATIERTTAVVEKAESIIMSKPGVENVVAMVGYNLLAGQQEPHSASLFTRLAPWDDRTTPQTSLNGIMGAVQKEYMGIKEAFLMAFAPPPIRGVGSTGGFQCRLLMRGDANMTKLAMITQQFMAKAKEAPELTGIMSQMRPDSPTLYVDVDREHAKALGVPLGEIFTTLQSTIGYTNLNQFDKQGRTYWVQVQADAQFRATPNDIGRAYVRSNNGKMIPLSSLVRVTNSADPSKIERFNGMLATQIMGASSPGHSSGEAIMVMEKLASEILPPEVDFAWEGIAFQQKRVGDRSSIIFGFALIMVFLILSAQYEKWTLPTAVMLVVPFGMLGAFSAVLVMGLMNDVYFQIGLLTLIGLSTKNSILVVEFAEAQRKAGMSVYEATKAAALLRYRPMMMTSIAFIFGVLPLVLSTGAGAESRHSIGTGIIGGMIAATFVERYFIPWLYYWVATFIEKRSQKGAQNG